MGIRPLPITSRQELIRDTRLIYSPLIALPQLERNRSGNNPPPRPSWRNWPFFLLWKGFWRAKGSPFSSWTKDINGGLTRRTNEGSARRRWPNKEERRLPRCQSGRNPQRETKGRGGGREIKWVWPVSRRVGDERKFLNARYLTRAMINFSSCKSFNEEWKIRVEKSV